ncbi:MAG: type I methionyl aminopeptidase [Candidatus Sericytochromatia bacterium]|nr:type I methionyl aminopeptidase [Candidatus Sericytochromatia bacterium]
MLTPAQIDAMREAGRVVGGLLAFLRREAREGVSTRDLDEAAEDFIRARGAVPAFKGIYGYKYTICASENEKVVHGLPNRRRLQAGDVVGLDMGAIVDGMYADAAITVPVGEVSSEAFRLLRVTEESLWRAIPLIRDGVSIGDLGHAVQSHAEAEGFSVVREYVGHGIGTSLHMAPQIPNYGERGAGVRLVAGMAVAVEPMINAGVPETKVLADRWTVVTADRKLSAHFEHTILVGDQPEVLTLEEGRDYDSVRAVTELPKAVQS